VARRGIHTCSASLRLALLYFAVSTHLSLYTEHCSCVHAPLLPPPRALMIDDEKMNVARHELATSFVTLSSPTSDNDVHVSQLTVLILARRSSCRRSMAHLFHY